MILYIDTSEYNQALFGLVDTKVKQLSKTFTHSEGHKLLSEVQAFLKNNKSSLEDVSKIVVCTGPGSFTGLRVGLALAKGLAFGKNIPVLGIEKSKVPEDLTKLKTTKFKARIELTYDKPSYMK